MILVGLFIDMYLMIPFLQTPSSLTGKILMFAVGFLLIAMEWGFIFPHSLGQAQRQSDACCYFEDRLEGWKSP